MVKLIAQAGLNKSNWQKHQEHIPSQKIIYSLIVKRFLLLVGALVHYYLGVVARIQNQHKNFARVFHLTASRDKLHRIQLHHFFSSILR